jgi:formylglycine-generating enzyme required for sulfatase activity
MFRWCEPGSFEMGWPDEESEQESSLFYGKETLHTVTFSQGFWLADTTVTQALWQAVMGENPSHFKGENRPVERVSWQDAKKFITQLNKLIPGLAVQLPTEAQWEYGCRAGTETPFSFGENITPDQVNYDGNYPYDKGKKGKNRGKTVPVKSLPCNDWGLYEMHGNVLEWCLDWYQEDLGKEPVLDPSGPESGEFRVLRGGSWISSGRDVRSAIRDGYVPGDRYRFIGFRLSQGHGLR